MNTYFLKQTNKKLLVTAVLTASLFSTYSSAQVVNDPGNTMQNTLNNAHTLKQLVDSGKELLEIVEIASSALDIVAQTVLTVETLQDQNATLGQKLSAISGLGKSTHGNASTILDGLAYVETQELLPLGQLYTQRTPNNQYYKHTYQQPNAYSSTLLKSASYQTDQPAMLLKVSTTTEKDLNNEKTDIDTIQNTIEALKKVVDSSQEDIDTIYSKTSGDLTQQDRLQIIAFASLKNSDMLVIQAQIDLAKMQLDLVDKQRKYNIRKDFVEQSILQQGQLLQEDLIN